MSTQISVVIPCKNGADVLGRQLEALLAQKTNAAFEVIVADNGSTDDTAAVVRSYHSKDPRVRLVDARRAPGANAARNEGVAHAKGSFILLTDADDLVHDDWIEAHWRAHLRGAQVVGGGLDRVLESGVVLGRERKLYRSFAGRKPFANATNCGFSRGVFDELGGFDESFIGGSDEVEFFCRVADAGYDLVLVPDAVVSKLQHTNLADAYTQYFNFGRGEVRLMRKFRGRVLWPLVLVSFVQAVVWGVWWGSGARLSWRARRTATCSVAWNLGVVSEAVRLSS